MTIWTENEENIIKNQYLYVSDEQLAAFISATCGVKRSAKSIEHRRRQLGLRKPDAAERNQGRSSAVGVGIQRF